MFLNAMFQNKTIVVVWLKHVIYWINGGSEHIHTHFLLLKSVYMSCFFESNFGTNFLLSMVERIQPCLAL